VIDQQPNDPVGEEHQQKGEGDRVETRRAILELLAGQRIDARLGRGYHYFFESLKSKVGQDYKRFLAIQEIWQMIGQGLVYIDFEQSAPENWELILTEKGKHIVESGDNYSPYDPDGYLARLRKRIPQLDETVALYASESLRSFNADCYISTLVMLGVASEKAFLLLAEAFANWLPVSQSEKLLSIILDSKQNVIAKFTEFRKRIEPCKPKLPAEFADNMALTLDSVFDLIRIYRNESGHPTGKRTDKDDAFITLQMFAAYLQKMFGLMSFFKTTKYE
jgi:hypothetical protein